MLEMYVRLTNLLRSEKGQDLVEYALIAVLIALAATGAMLLVGSQISTVFEDISTSLSGS